MGKLADSVKKWADVTVPEGLGTQLSSLAPGIGAFNFSGWGADAIASMAEPLGMLADSVGKWSGVVIPEGLGDQLRTLAPGISAFNFAGWGADTIGALVEPLGALAGSISAWSDVTVPEGIEEDLTGLANGVNAWSLAFMGGWSIGAVIEPLKNLAESVTAWNDVNVPDGIQGDLESLAEGVKAWSLAFMGGWSIDAVIEPLKNLADAIKTWNGVAIPDGLGGKLESLATGVDAFSGITVGDLTGTCDGIRAIGDAAKDISGIDFGGVASNLTSFATAVNSIDVSANNFTNLGSNIINNLVGAINSGFGRVRSTMSSLAGVFQTSGVEMVAKFAGGITSATGNASSAVRSMASSAASSATYSSATFWSAGYNCAIGFANGISSGSFAATMRARAMANAAAQAAKDALDINSPSKVFMKIGQGVPEGFAKGIDKYGYYVGNSINTMATSALDNTKSVIARVGDIVSNIDMDSQPTIRPVIDMSNVESSAAAINGMFSKDLAIGTQMNLNAISTSMRRNRQNGTNSDVVSAIGDLRRDISKIEKPSYSIGGITYSHGDEISEALETIVRYANIERRV